MTVKNEDGSAVETSGSAGSEGSGSVSREAYQRVLDQRKADRDRAKAAEEKLTQLEAEREAAEAERLAQANEYKKLFETEKKKREEAESKISQMTQGQVTRAKQDALKAELGISKSEYLSLADLSGIQMGEDGSADPESVKAVANKFRQSYPELLPKRSGSRLPNDAAGDSGPRQGKLLKDMTQAELRAAFQAKLRAESK